MLPPGSANVKYIGNNCYTFEFTVDKETHVLLAAFTKSWGSNEVMSVTRLHFALKD